MIWILRYLIIPVNSNTVYVNSDTHENYLWQVINNKIIIKMAAAMEGPLSKWTNVMKGWQYRWFVLDDNTGLLSYYTVQLIVITLNMSITFHKYVYYPWNLICPPHFDFQFHWFVMIIKVERDTQSQVTVTVTVSVCDRSDKKI